MIPKLTSLLLILAGATQFATAAVLVNERFDQDVPDNSPIGAAPGWHAYALHNGVVTDYTTSTPNGNYPTISHSTAGAGSGGVGYLVFGAGNLVSNVLVWLDTPTNFQGKLISDVSFYSRNNSAASTERIVLRIGTQWYASTQTWNDAGGGSSWTLNEFVFNSAAASWRLLNTNNLTLGATLVSPLPAQNITAIGFFGSIQKDAGKIRLDELLVNGFATNAPPELAIPTAQPGTNVYAGTTVTLDIAADGVPPLTYQWRKNGANLINGPNLSGANTRSLTLSNATPADSGIYEVIVSNAFGTNTSAALPLTVAVATPAVVDWSGFNASGAIAIANSDPNTLVVTWTNKVGNAYRAEFNLIPGQVLLRRLETAPTIGGAFSTIAQDVDVRYRVTLGSRFEKAGWPYIFFDRVDANTPTPVPHVSSLDPQTVRVVSESSHRTKLIFSGLNIGPYAGEMTCLIYDGSPFLQFQASMEVTQPWEAYIYDALFYANFANVAYRDSNGAFQTVAAASLPQTGPGEPARVTAKHRTIMGTVTGGSGTLAVMSPPHAAIYPIDQSDNYGFLQAGKTFIGTKMSFSADNRYRPWVDAPIGSTQRMDVFLVLNAGTPQVTLTNVLNYTHGDFFKPLPGYYTMAEHFHPEFTANYRSGRDTLTPFKQTMQSIGVRIVQPMEFHGPGNPFNNTTNRLAELRDMFTIFAANSDENFLLIPGEEYNNWFGGHWSYMFTRPVYFTGWPGQGSRPFKVTNLVADSVTYPLVYQVGDADRMSQLLQEEGGLAWTSHPRIKGSRQNPDIFANTDFFKDDSFLAGDWKSMPLDLSKDRLGFRSFQLMDDIAQWGYRKAMLGEVDTFLLDPTHEIYAHMNVNYLQLPGFPSKTNWASVAECVRNGEFFTTTGELLIHQWNATTTGVTATVEWYFPPAFAEITWGDNNGVHKLKRALTNGIEFETQQLVMPADLSAANWVRFEVWDVARNGAFTQQRWLNPPAKPEVITGATTSFTLIDADTDAPVAGYDPIPSEAVLNKATLPPNLTIRANVSPLLMDSVVVNLNGSPVTRTQWPYSVANCTTGPGIGDSAAYNYAATVLNTGNHVITATPYRGATPGKPLTLNFSVIHSNPPATSFNMDGRLDSHGYQVALDGKLFAAIKGSVLYLAAPATDGADQFVFITDQLGALSAAPANKAGQVAFDINTKPFLMHNGGTRFLTWNNGGANAFCPALVPTGYLEGRIDLATAFGAMPSVIYVALARYAAGNGGALLPATQIPTGNGNGNIENTEFLTIPVATIRDEQLNGSLDVLEPDLAFTASFDKNPGVFIVRWPAVPGYTYQVHASDTLQQSFAPLSGLLSAGLGMFSMSYTDLPPTTVSQRFYRVSRLSSAANLLSRFKFNGDFNDSGPSALAAAPTAVTFTNDCKEGDSAAHFDGVASFVQTSAPNPVSRSFSVAFWLKTVGPHPATPGDQWFLGAGLVDADTPGVNTDWGIAMTGSAVAFGIGGGSVGANTTITSSPVNDGDWNHVVASWNADTRQMNLYLNGENNVSGLSTSGENRTGAAALVLGRCATANRFFRGLLDDIQIFDHALTLGDVSFLAHAPGLNLQ
jgi:hypothetical protein